MDINPIRPTDAAAAAAGGAGATGGDSSVSFKDLLKDAVAQVNQLQQNADTASQSLAAGQPVGLDEVMLAVQKADLALQMTMAIRNKLVDAYTEIKGMQI